MWVALEFVPLLDRLSKYDAPEAPPAVEVDEIAKAFPVVRPLAEILPILPVVAELAVRLNTPVPV